MLPAPKLTAKTARALRGAVPFAVLTALLFIFTRRYHEFWRDEIQALLIGRDVPLSGLLHAMRYEGAPPLFHLLLKLLCYVFAAPTALALGGALGYAVLLAGTFHLLRVISRRPAVSVAITVALGCTNTWFYELGVVVRPYGIGLGLDLAGIAELIVARKLRRPRRALAGAILCGAAATTSAHAACVAGAALASFVIAELASRRRVALALPALASLPFFALTAYLISPFADRTPEGAAAQNPKLANAFSLAGNFLENGALVGGWWRHAGAEPPPNWPAFRMFAAAMAILLVVRLWRRRRDRATDLFVVGTVALSWATLLYIFVVWYGGGYRHHLFLWMPALVAALGWLADGRFARGRAKLALGAAALLLVPWMGYQYWMAWDDLSQDLRAPFSQTKHAAEALPKDAHVVSDHDFAILGLRLWRDDVTLRSQDGRGRAFQHIVVDRAWHQRVALQPILAEECRAAPDRTVLASHAVYLGKLQGCARLIDRRAGMLPTERFDLYLIDCACALR
jgi:hypothetical protein